MLGEFCVCAAGQLLCAHKCWSNRPIPGWNLMEQTFVGPWAAQFKCAFCYFAFGFFGIDNAQRNFVWRRRNEHARALLACCSLYRLLLPSADLLCDKSSRVSRFSLQAFERQQRTGLTIRLLFVRNVAVCQALSLRILEGSFSRAGLIAVLW